MCIVGIERRVACEKSRNKHKKMSFLYCHNAPPQLVIRIGRMTNAVLFVLQMLNF